MLYTGTNWSPDTGPSESATSWRCQSTLRSGEGKVGRTTVLVWVRKEVNYGVGHKLKPREEWGFL